MFRGEPHIVVAGEAIFDLIPTDRPGVYESALGGSSFNTAIGLGRLGAAASYCGRLSTDAAGERFMQALAAANVDASLVARTPEPSALALVAPGTEATGPSYALYLTGTSHDGPAGLPSRWPRGAVHLHAASFHAMMPPTGDGVLAAMRGAAAVASISFDPNIRPPVLPPRDEVVRLAEARVALSTIVKASEEDLRWLYPARSPKESIAAWSKLGPRLAVLTRGENGALALGGFGSIDVSAPSVAVVDTVGAGDAFTAALLAELMRLNALGPGAIANLTAYELQDCLAFATTAAALNCARRGADPPTRAEIEAF